MPDTESEFTVTQLTDIEVDRVDLVENPANGYPFILIKAVNAAGGVDEAPDIDGAEHVLQLLAQLMINEAQELKVGNWDETCDIELLCQAASLMKHFRYREQIGEMEEDGSELTKSAVESIFKRKISSGDRKRLAAEGKALPDGSYPIENAGDLHNAAILARSGHGDVAAAKRLIAKRAKELGVKNPLADDKNTEKASAEDVTPAVNKASDKEPENKNDDKQPDVGELVKSAVAEAMKDQEAANSELRAEIAKLRETAIPGGPFFTAPNRKAAEDKVSKAAQFEQLSENPDLDRDLAKFYRTEAARLRAEAA